MSKISFQLKKVQPLGFKIGPVSVSPVTSVNGQTGEVVLTTQDLENTSGYQTDEQVAETVEQAIEQEAERADEALALHAGNEDIHVTPQDKTDWDNKYDKPTSGIPKSDLDSDVQSSLDKADSALQEHQSLSAYRTSSAQDTIDAELQEQIDALVSKSDVVDVVGTYAELVAYDTTTLHHNDVVKVLSDSTHDNSRSYYRWIIVSDIGSWDYVGSEAIGYTKGEADGRFVQKETGKGLSSNDFTNTLKNKLDNIEAEAEKNIINGIKKNGASQTPDESGIVNITVPVSASDIGALPNTVKYGYSLEVSMNSTTYVCTFKLKDQDGNLLGTQQTIDFPLESVVVSGRYDSTTKKIILTLQSGSEIEIPVASLVSGLVNETELQQALASYYTKTEADSKFIIYDEETPSGSTVPINADQLNGKADTAFMEKTDFDPNGAVEEAGGIPAYVADNGGKIDKIIYNGRELLIVNKTITIVPNITYQIEEN